MNNPSFRVFFGGSWTVDAYYICKTRSDNWYPGDSFSDVGFRLVSVI